jgi:hypothetical protein
MTKKTETAYAKQERQYQVENAMSTLKKAADIRKDPALMRDVQKALQQVQAACGVKGKATPVKKKK